MPNANIVEIYYMLDEFSKLFDAALQAHGLKLGRGGARRRASLMSDAEVMTILVLFHTSGCRTLKASYLGWVCGMLKRVCQIEHTQHRSFPSFEANLCSGLIAYSFLPNKPKIHLANESAAIHQTVL